MKEKRKDSYTLKDAYKEYIKMCPKGHKFYRDWETYSRINYMFNKLITNRLLEGHIIKLPFGLSRMMIYGHKLNFARTNKLPVDFKATKEYGKVIYFTNDHSNECIYRFKWVKKLVRNKNKKFYSFIPSRTNKRRLAHILNSGNNPGYEIGKNDLM